MSRAFAIEDEPASRSMPAVDPRHAPHPRVAIIAPPPAAGEPRSDSLPSTLTHRESAAMPSADPRETEPRRSDLP